MLVILATGHDAASQGESLVPFQVVDDAIPQPLTASPGDAARGRAIALDRAKGNCITCHELPVRADFQGNLGPPLAGVAARYSLGELRLRVVDGKRLNPESNMPSYYRTHGLVAVRRESVGRPILTAQEVEDVLAYLQTLR
ncbi:sulfur oxidation c-type cytochrome SoxX [Sediminicoccus sp. KRV36]|uniref:sulfur oxidation c-type cytochrome SoxX n=1 Tax=Sediminicoccus sp. KRV36 TaxID=3133721 RepID=UPI00200CFF35|nr:sulfur oxidation c-type cytochrome SoxX [Sediminicoccus rosea]UPY35588.1 sulfur oxidation c-type cytochrome SoxX [Sediminicoccus rosea]